MTLIDLSASPTAFQQAIKHAASLLLNEDRFAHYRTEDGIVAFVQEVLGATPHPYQETILRLFVRHKRLAVYGLHGLGKTATIAWIVLWFMACFPSDVKIPTTASVYKQLKQYLWPEIHKWAMRADWSIIGLDLRNHLLDMSIKMSGKEAWAVTVKDAANIEGAHAQVLAYIFDEAKAIPDAIWDAAEGAFSNAGEGDYSAYSLAFSTPGEPQGRFYDICSRKRGFEDWHVYHVTLQDAIDAGAVSATWANQRKQQWGEKHPLFIQKVLGQFASFGANSIIPLSYVESAIERFDECNGKGQGETFVGVDVAWEGDDDSVIARIVGNVLEELLTFTKSEPMETVGHVVQAVNENTTITIGVDSIGIGAGVYSRLEELGYNAYKVNAAASVDGLTDDEQGYLNLRAAMWWLMRRWLDPEGRYKGAIPNDPILVGELTAPLSKVSSNGKMKVESKAEIRKRLGRSTDKADAFAIALYMAIEGGGSWYADVW